MPKPTVFCWHVLVCNTYIFAIYASFKLVWKISGHGGPIAIVCIHTGTCIVANIPGPFNLLYMLHPGIMRLFEDSWDGRASYSLSDYQVCIGKINNGWVHPLWYCTFTNFIPLWEWTWFNCVIPVLRRVKACVWVWENTYMIVKESQILACIAEAC